jgi:RNA polymerase sigma-70 factor (ECF subfamily)
LNIESQTEADWCERLYEAKAAQLLLYGRALGLSHSESEDVLQATFEALITLSERPERPVHYCLRSFRNRALNCRRSLWRRIAREFESRRWFEHSEEQTEREWVAMRCLARLPQEQREAIVLKIWYEYTFEEMGDLLSISPHTVAGRYRYGLRKLRSILEGHEYEKWEVLGTTDALLETTPPGANR